ncbi:MAG: glycosyltransferase [Thalassotalea sp.]|nr:glycosyltransferase [Thalassotalea sp.]
MAAKQIFFTVVIPTRNRPELFKLALDSVLNQSFQDFEVVIVNDGTDPEFMEAYKALEESYCGRYDNLDFRYQIKRPNGHGQSYSMNTGAYVGMGQYVCFLDDDDFWIDANHLENAHASIVNSTSIVDCFYTNQDAYFSDGSKQENNVWIEDLVPMLTNSDADPYGAYSVSQEFLLKSAGFAHLNCSIVRRELYLSIKGMDENIRYECDRDIYIRTIDAAETILYNPNVIAKHHIPDSKKADNMSTLVSSLEKKLYQIVVYEKGLMFAKHDCIRLLCQRGLSDIFKFITTEYVSQKNYSQAHIYAVKALGLRFSLKWWLYTKLLCLKAL